MKFIVRELIPDDLPVIYGFMKDREISYLINHDPMEGLAEFINRYNFYFTEEVKDLKIFSVTLDDYLIGKMEIYYNLHNKSSLFSILIGDKSLWGKGYATKALSVLFSYGFNNLGLNRIACEVYRYNERMIRLMGKMKMNVDGILRSKELINNRFNDIYVFSILKKEYEGDAYND